MTLYQVSYASCATASQDALLNDLRNILTEARDFNVRHNLTGVLYFADGYFFQCLEGEKAVLEILIEKLEKDTRHRNFKLFEYQPIQHRYFFDWSMKYVKRNSLIQNFMLNHGFTEFKPKLLSRAQVDQLIHLLADIKD